MASRCRVSRGRASRGRASRGRAFGERGDTPSSSPRSGSRSSAAAATLVRPSITHYTCPSRFSVWLMIILVAAATCFGPTWAQQQSSNFSVGRTSYKCGSNVICLGGAHVYQSDDTNKIQAGMLSLIQEVDGSQTTGMAYFAEPVRLLDPASGNTASFSTSFQIEVVNNSAREINGPADGMAFVICASADNSTLGQYGRTLGIFNADGYTSFKSVVVEFDEYDNDVRPVYDFNDNHVSFDYSNITTNVTADAAAANVILGDGQTTYGWVDYSNETRLLEVRVSNSNVRPTMSLLNDTVDLFDVAEEFMWFGFSSGASFRWSNYYIGNWTFESHGIPPTSPAPIPSPGKSSGSKVGLIVGISLGVPAALLAFLCIAVVVRRRSRRGWSAFAEDDDPSLQIEGMPERLSYKQLSVATGGFSKESKLGRGGFGSVYRGVLSSSGSPVAVKKIDGDSTQGEKEFMAEVSIISRLRHRNLIQLLGWCKDKSRGSYLLVYELMPNGSLDKVLFPSAEKKSSLSWPQRLNIVTGTAAALEYLHQGWKQQVIHRDIKSSNIMLDENWNAKLGDFGLARLVDHEREAATTLVAGTYGYIAPEVAASGRFTDKTDVYAFGAVVLEVACGRKALSVHAPPNEMILVEWVWQCRSEGHLLSAVDKQLEDYDAHWMEVLLLVGLLCSHPNPLARPTMRHVVQILAGDAPVPHIPNSKPVLVFSSDSQGISISESLYRHSDKSSSSSKSISMVSTNFSDSTGGSTVKWSTTPSSTSTSV